jgi:pyruvate formate lyase activating enzyme
VISSLAHATDLLLYDIKFADTHLHRQYVGVSNELILENLKKLAQWHPHIQVRVPCITGVNDGVDQIRETAKQVAQMGLTHLVLLPYNEAAGAKYAWLGQPFVCSNIKRQSEKYMALLADVCREVGLAVSVGG